MVEVKFNKEPNANRQEENKMKKNFLISATIIVLGVLLLCGEATSAPTPKGEIIYAVTSLGSENFSLAQQFGVSLPAQVQETIIRTNLFCHSCDFRKFKGFIHSSNNSG